MSSPTPWLRIEPPEAEWSARSGTVEVSWDSGSSARWEVWTRRDDAEPKLFGAGPKGSREATWINVGHTYHFWLSPPGEPDRPAVSLTTTMALRHPDQRTAPFLRLTPNPFPRDDDEPLVRLDWDTGDGSDGTVVLVSRGDPGEREAVAGQGPVGTRLIDFIRGNQHVEFRLYRSAERTKRPLATVVGRRAGERREVALDVIALIVVLALWPVAAAGRAWRRVSDALRA